MHAALANAVGPGSLPNDMICCACAGNTAQRALERRLSHRRRRMARVAARKTRQWHYAVEQRRARLRRNVLVAERQLSLDSRRFIVRIRNWSSPGNSECGASKRRGADRASSGRPVRDSSATDRFVGWPISLVGLGRLAGTLWRARQHLFPGGRSRILGHRSVGRVGTSSQLQLVRAEFASAQTGFRRDRSGLDERAIALIFGHLSRVATSSRDRGFDLLPSPKLDGQPGACGHAGRRN